MTNILGDDTQQQVLALGRLGWPLRRIQAATGVRRETARAYGVLFDDPAMANDPKRIPVYLRAKRSWFVIDTTGVVRYTMESREIIPNDEILEVLQKLDKS